jgi:hypothetical protein
MNLAANNVPRKTSLRDRRENSKQARPEKTRRGGDRSGDDAVAPVAGRARTANGSLVLNLQRDSSNDDQRRLLEEALKRRQPNQNQRPIAYKGSGKKPGRADLSFEDAGHAVSTQGRDEPGTVYDPVKLREAFKELFPTWRELRQAIHNPEKLQGAIEATPEQLEKLKTVTARELRNGSVRVHTAIGGVVPLLTGLDILKFGIRLVGPEACPEAVAESRRRCVSAY